MKLFVILEWKWEVETTVESDFKVLGIFSDIEYAQFNLDKLQRDALIRETRGCFFWIEEHNLNELKEGVSR